MTRLIYICGILQVVAVGYGCSDKGDTVLPPKVEAQPTLVCTPDSGYVGETFFLTGESFKIPSSQNILLFFDNIEKRADSGSTSKIYASVPFGATTGAIQLKLDNKTFTSSIFRIRESYSTNSLNIAWYNLTPAITALDSSTVDYAGIRRIWQATVSRDTIHVRRSHSFFEGYAEYHFVFKNNGQNNLPQLIIAWVFFQDDTNQRTWDTLSVGIMKLQNWNTSIALSGKFISKPYDWGPFTFWVSANNITQ